jgi:hypothetical protein
MDDKKYSYELLGVMVERSAQSVRNYVEGTQIPGVHTALRIARALDKPVAKLWPTD